MLPVATALAAGGSWEPPLTRSGRDVLKVYRLVAPRRLASQGLPLRGRLTLYRDGWEGTQGGAGRWLRAGLTALSLAPGPGAWELAPGVVCVAFGKAASKHCCASMVLAGAAV